MHVFICPNYGTQVLNEQVTKYEAEEKVIAFQAQKSRDDENLAM